MEVSVQPCALASLPLGKSTWYPLNRRLGGCENQSGCSGVEKNLLPLPGFEPQIIQPVAQSLLTMLYPVSQIMQILIQQNSFNPAYMGTDRFKYCGFSECMSTDQSSCM